MSGQPEKKLTMQGHGVMTRQTSWADETEQEELPYNPPAQQQAAPVQQQQEQRRPAANRSSEQSDRRQGGGNSGAGGYQERRQGGGYQGGDRQQGGDRDRRDGGARSYEDRRQQGGDRQDDRRQGGNSNFGSSFNRDRDQQRGGEDRREDRRQGGGYREAGAERREGERAERRADHRDEPREKTPMPSQGPWKAYVGNLSYDLPSETIAAFFEHDGNGPSGIKVLNVIVPKRHDDKPNSHVYVEFADRESLEGAIKLDGAELAGRAVKIDVAAARQTGGYGGSSRGYGSERRDGSAAAGGDAAASAGVASNEPPKERKKLALAPRSAAAPAAAASASAAAPAAAAAVATPSSDAAPAARKPNPFGDAKPREEILIGRGVDPVAADSKADKSTVATKQQQPQGDNWSVAKGEQKQAGGNKKQGGGGGDAASHPVASSSNAGGARSGVVRGGRTGPVGSRGDSSAAAGPEKVMTRLADAPAAAPAKKVPVGQAPPTKKVAKQEKAGNVFASLMGDDDEEEEEQE